MKRWLRGAFCALAMTGCALPSPAAANVWGAPEPVAIDGYDGHAMEPFISCDGAILLFNNRNQREDRTDLHWATRVTDAKFTYRGPVRGTDSGVLEGVPSMDCSQTLYFISPRSYDESLSTVYRAKFAEGAASGIERVKGLAAARRGIVTFDAEISRSGGELYAADGTYDGLGGPHTADLFLAKREGDAFERQNDSAGILANVNTAALEYAPSVSQDGLDLFFTRLNGAWFWRHLSIEHATRGNPNEPWAKSKTIATITGFVEAPSISADGKTLYFHQKSDDGMHKLFLVRRP